MSDTAEYWHGIRKGRSHFKGPDYYHIPDVDCGHFHWYTAKFIEQVNCKGCLKLIREGLVHNLAHEPLKVETRRKRKIKNPMQHCPECSGILTERTNSKDGSKFMGCSNFPLCTHTENIWVITQVTDVILVTPKKDVDLSNLIEPNNE